RVDIVPDGSADKSSSMRHQSAQGGRVNLRHIGTKKRRRVPSSATTARASVPRLATWHAIVQGILATIRRQATRYRVHDRNDLPHNITAIAAGGIFEQIAHRGANLRLGVVWTAKIPIK